MKCTFAFLQNHIQLAGEENKKQKQQQEKEEKDRKKALQFLNTLKSKKCSKCQTKNVGSALYCKSCGAIIPE
ncbi:MAG: hypothetical protein NWE83_00485 [Candidatus Bathyarchaeota archaeon]|nr:hypothetical protein [Candidatus Bathyarchaeota archaeon]